MSSRTNSCSELVKLWLEARHGLLVTESMPVSVPYGHSDIDIIALHPRSATIPLPSGVQVGPRLIVESKDEHDWDPSGKEFATLLRLDMVNMAGHRSIPLHTKGIKFSMLKQEHFDRASDFFGTDDFDRLFVTHAMDFDAIRGISPDLTKRRVHWLTIDQVVRDLVSWYDIHPHPTTLRSTPTGDLIHLLFGFCNLRMHPSTHSQPATGATISPLDSPRTDAE